MCAAATRPAVRVDGYLFVECPVCGFAFAPELGVDACDDAPGPAPDAAPDWTDEGFVAWLAAVLADRRPARVLDFGTGQSEAPDRLRQRGHRVVAVDPVPPRRRHADRLTGRLEDCGLAAHSFDLAYAYQVFEHLPEPRAQLHALLRLTRPGGLVVIHTDMEVPEREAGLEHWWYVMPPDHCCFFRHRSFEIALGDTGHHIVHRSPKMLAIEIAC